MLINVEWYECLVGYYSGFRTVLWEGIVDIVSLTPRDESPRRPPPQTWVVIGTKGHWSHEYVYAQRRKTCVYLQTLKPHGYVNGQGRTETKLITNMSQYCVWMVVAEMSLIFTPSDWRNMYSKSWGIIKLLNQNILLISALVQQLVFFSPLFFINKTVGGWSFNCTWWSSPLKL